MGFSLDDYIREKSGGSVRQANSIGATGKGGFSLDRYMEGMRSPAPDLNTWFQDSSSTLDSIAKQAEGWKNTYITPSEIDTSVNQSTKSINDIIRTGLGLHKRFSENKSVYDAIYGEGSSDDTIENINGVIQQLEKMRLGLSQERDFRNSLEGEKAFQDYLIASGDEAAAKSVMSGLEKSKAENEKKLAELRAQLEKTGDKWYTKTLSSLLSDRKPIQDQIKELEARQKELQDQYSRYYYTTENRDKLKAIESDPESGALYDAANVLRSDMEKVSAIGDEALYHKGNPEVSAYKEYLKDKYGLTEDAIQNYVSGGSGYRYSKNGYGNLWQLYEELEKQLTDTKGRLAENGYDYDRMTGYEQSLVDAEEYRKKQKEWEQYATKHPIASSISSVIMSPFQGLDYLRLGIENVGKNNVNDPENYVPLNVYDMDATNYVSAIRGTVSKNIEKNTDWNLFGQNVASFLYQTGMSVADSAAQIAAFGNGAVFLMGASAASNQAKNVIERGGSNSQAFWGGLAAGAAEALFEKISVDRLLKPKSITGWKSLLKETVKQAGVEASEEMLTEIANILSDSAIMGESSDFSVSVKAYQEQGLSESEAKKKAFLECIGQVAWAGAGGVLSGGIMGGAAGSLNIANQGVNNRNVGNQVMRSGLTDETIDDGLRLDTDDPLYKLAEKLAERQNQGKPLSPKKVGQLETGLEAKTLDRLESMRSQMARTLSGDTQNGDETAPLGTVYTKSKTAQNGPSNAQDGHSANADVQTNVPYTVNVEAAKPLDAQARMGNSAVTVQGVESVQDGDVTVNLSDGTKVPLYDVEIADPQIRQLYDTAAKYDTNTAKAFVSGFDGSLPISTYQSAFDYFMTQAKHGVSMDEAMQHAGLAGQMMSPVSRQTAYFAGENLQSSGSRGNMGAENAATGGMNNVSVRQDTGAVLGRRGFQSDDGRIQGQDGSTGGRGNEGSGVRETAGGRQETSQITGGGAESRARNQRPGGRETSGKTDEGSRYAGERAEQGKPGEVDKHRYIHREIQVSDSADTAPETISFDAVRPDLYTKAQKRAVEVGKEYGKTVYYVRRGDPINIGGRNKRMKGEAFTIPGTDIIFAAHDTKVDFIHHELFHQFLALNRHQEKTLYWYVTALTDKSSGKYEWYRNRAEVYYGSGVSDKIILEEITCDLCEYAMSGSEKMYNRLNGLFEGDTLETLAEQAREVFEANREAYQAGEGQKSPDTRFYMDDAVEEVRGIRAYHGMTTEDLDSAVQSGLPPLHTDGAGDISLLFRPEASLSYDTETPVQDTGFGTRLSSIAERMAGGRTADAMESSRALLDVLSRSHTKEDIRKSLESLGKFSVTDEIVADIFSLSNDMAESPGMVYRDAAGLEDVAAAVVPDTLDEDLKTQLNAAGIKTVEYKAGDDADRVRALNEAPELRFYLEDISPVDVDLLTEENQALREQVETLRGEFQLTKGHKVKPASIGKLADTILKETSSSYDKGTLVKNLDALFSYIANDPDANFDEAMDVSVEIANSVLRESSALDSTLYEKYRDMREYFRKTAISLDEDIRAGMDYERFRKEHFGGFRLTNDGTSLDSLWSEISGRWPEFFSPDTPIQDQPQVVADALRTVRPSYVNPYGMDATEAAYDLAMRVYEEYFNLPEIHTFADKKKAELTQLRAKYENRIQAIRKGYKAKEQALVQEQRQKRKDLKDENRLRLAAQMEKVREQRKAAADKRRESALVRRYKPRIIRDTMELGRWLTHPTDKKHVPEPFRKAVAEFVNTIDFSSDRLNSKGKPTMRTMAMQKLFNQMNTILKSESGTFEEAQAIFDGADPDLIPNMADLIQNAEQVRIEDMTGTQLGELAHVVAALKSMLTNANTLISGERTRAAEQVAKGIHMDLMGQEAKEYTGLLGLGKRLVNYDMMDAPSYFEELGDTAYREIYKPLRRGFDRKIQNTTEAVAYMQRLLKGIDTDTWSGPKAEKHTFKVKGGTVSLTTAQIMSLYELSKRDQARGHILGGGIRPSDTVKKMRIDKTFRPVTLTAQDLKEIVGTLTPEQRAVADGIADFFKVTAEWGNEVSMKLYGYRKFTEQNYFPIVSDKNYLTTMQGDLKRPDAVLKNLGMTKSTVAGANNPIMVEDIFDVFTRQADQMGSYNAFVVPLSDLSKVFNFKASEPGGEVQGSIKESLERALGHDAVTYWNKLVEDINGVSKQTPPTIGDKLLSNMKAAAVGANLRVIIQQPTAYLRAAALIDPKYLAKGLATKSDIDEMNEYAPIAYWKDLGFFEMDTARGMKDILMGKKGLRDIAMKPAGWADTKTWGKLWNAVKAEIRDTTDFKPGTVEFLEAAGERFSEIIDRTQVVDSVLHRSQMMRSKNFINKTVTSFMSEPTKAYNMLRSAVRDVQKNGWKKGRGRLVRVTVAHTATSILTALLAALVDAIRDDDEEKKWWEKYLSAVGENTLDNLSPLNMLPYLKDVASLLSGYNLTRQEMAGLTDVVNAGRAWMSYFQGDSKYSVAWLIKNSAASISKLTGIPVAAATRDLEALVGGSIRTLGDFGVPTARLEYILDTFYYPVNSKNASRYAGRAYDAYRENNPKLAKDILEAMEKGGISEEKIVYYMRKNLRERDDRIAEAGRAKLDGNMSAYARIVGEIRNDGFDREWVVGAVDGWVSKLESAAKEKADGKTKELKESLEEITDSGADQEWAEDAVNRLADSQKKRPANDSDDEEEYEGLFEGSDVVMALEAGNTKEAKAVIQEMTDNGKEESSIRSSVTRYYKPIYQDLYKRKDEAGMRKLRETLVGLGIGYKSGDFTRWIQDMEK